MSRRAWAVFAMLVLSLSAVLAGTASAHAELRESSPGQDAVVGGEIGEIQLAFWSRLSPEGRNEISLSGPDGKPVAAAGKARLGAGVLAQPFEPLTVEGTYQVRYFVTAEDGEPLEGQYVFAFDSDAAAATPVVGAETLPKPGGAGAPIGAVAAFGAMAVFAVAVLWLVFGRRPRRPAPARGGPARPASGGQARPAPAKKKPPNRR